MKSKLKVAILKLIAKIVQGATVLSGILLMQLLVLLSGLIPGFDLVALLGSEVPYYADLIGVAAGYGILQALNGIPFMQKLLSS